MLPVSGSVSVSVSPRLSVVWTHPLRFTQDALTIDRLTTCAPYPSCRAIRFLG